MWLLELCRNSLKYLPIVNLFMGGSSRRREEKMNAINHDTRLWLVTIPNRLSEIGDILFETDLMGLYLQFLSQIPQPINWPTIYLDQKQAEAEASNRIMEVS